MKLYDGGMLIIIGVLAALALASVAATKVLKLEDDNVAEEFVEEIIQGQTGLDLDLSPSSPE
jgi:ABC-type siderophore export system fused ATPase/permease subunit